MSILSPTHQSIFTRGNHYRICWSTEANLQVLALYEDAKRNDVKYPVLYPDIISAIRRSPFDSQPVPVELGTADLGLFVVKSRGIVYDVLVSYHPATSPGGTYACEITGVSIRLDPDLLTALPEAVTT